MNRGAANVFHAGVVAPLLYFAGTQERPEWLKYVAAGVFVLHVYILWDKINSKVPNRNTVGNDQHEAFDYSPIPQVVRTYESPSEFY